MSAVLDTGIIYAYYDQRDAWHTRSVDFIRSEQGDLIVPATADKSLLGESEGDLTLSQGSRPLALPPQPFCLLRWRPGC